MEGREGRRKDGERWRKVEVREKENEIQSDLDWLAEDKDWILGSLHLHQDWLRAFPCLL